MAKPASEFLATPLVRQQIASAAKRVGEDAAEGFEQEMEQRIEANASEIMAISTLAFDSPLELSFWVWWMAFRRMDYFSKVDIEMVPHVEVIAMGNRYVFDFTLEPSPTRQKHSPSVQAWPRIGVELDGHAFHEKTLEQVTHRNQRDRELQQAGWQVFHYSFSEFTARPEHCVLEVIECAREQYGRILSAKSQ